MALITAPGGDYLVPELERRGHASAAVDLPAEDASAGVSHYANVALEALAGLDNDLVLVGHSLGALTAPVVAARRSVRHVVFLSRWFPRRVARFRVRIPLPRSTGGAR